MKKVSINKLCTIYIPVYLCITCCIATDMYVQKIIYNRTTNSTAFNALQ